MRRSVNYYSGLTADYSRPGLVSTEVADGLIDSADLDWHDAGGFAFD